MDEQSNMSEQNPRHDRVRLWLRRVFWYGVSIAEALGVVAVALFVPVFVVAALAAILDALVPSVGILRADWAILLSTVISAILVFIYLDVDRRKLHIGERLRRLREKRRQDGQRNLRE
jgi:hypothetical protein